MSAGFVVNGDVKRGGVLFLSSAGTSVIQVTATDADDPTYGNSARLVYSILQGQPYFSVEPHTGTHLTQLSLKPAILNLNTKNGFLIIINKKSEI